MVKLERSLNLWQVTLMSVGIILGAGIYVVIGEAVGLSGNAIWLSFIISALVASLTGLSYAELSSRFPKAGAEYIYIKNAFGEKLAWLTGWLIIAGSIIGATTVAVGFSRYFSALFHTPLYLTALVMLGVCCIILIVGIKETASLAILFTIIEASGLAIIIFIGIPNFGSVDYLEMARGMQGIVEAGVLVFFGYLGFEGITRLAEETKDPQKNIPRAIIISLIITTIIYILVGIAAISVVPWQELATSKAPLALVAERVFGENSFIILSTIALFSTFNTALVILLSGSRLIYGIADQKALPKIFLSVSPKTFTPWVAILAVVIASMAFIALGDLKTIANLTNFTIFVVFILVNASVIYLRYKKPIATGFRTPITIGRLPLLPLLGIIASCVMIINIPSDILLLGGGLILTGSILYLIWNKHEKKVAQ